MPTFSLRAPQLGEGIISLKIIKIYKDEGDYVHIDEPLIVVESEKAAFDIESPVSGRIKSTLCQQGDVVSIGTELICIEIQGNDTLAEKDVFNNKDNASNTPNFPMLIKSDTHLAVGLTPRIIGYCRRNGVKIESLAKIKGTGKDGMIRLQDVIAFNKKLPDISITAQTAFLAPAWIRHEIDKENSPEFSIHQISKQQIQLNYAMQQSLEIPQASISISVQLPQNSMATFVYAVAQASKKYEKLRAEYIDTKTLHIYKECNIGCAVSLPNDVLTSIVIENVCELTREEILAYCVEQTRVLRRSKNNLPIVRRHSISISDMSGFGIERANPIVVAPAVATLFIGTPSRFGDSNLTLSFDHRVMNGVYASRALKAIVAVVKQG